MREDKAVKWVAPPGGMLIQAYREEALLFEKEGKEHRARQYRRLADRMQEARDNSMRYRQPTK
jgi:hypothetical protein